MKNINEMTVEELRELVSIANNRINELTKDTVHCTFESDKNYDSRKHGHAYVAIVKGRDSDYKVIREFLNSPKKAYDSKRKYYHAIWEADLPIGTKIEARLDEGSWKNERRDYYIVTEKGLEEVTREEVLGV